MKEEFDYKEYWMERHKQNICPLKKSGIKSLSEETNRYFYYLVKDQYSRLLNECNISLENKSVLDAGAGTGEYISFFLVKRARVTAIDISENAVNHIKMKFPEVKVVVTSLEDLDRYFSSYQFDIIHCFDVLYHITDDVAWEKAIRNFVKISKKYIILHEKFSDTKPIISSKHIKWRSKEKTVTELKNYGFCEIGSIPTSVIRRLFTYRILDFFPSFYYEIDKVLLDTNLAYKIGESFIKIFRRDFE